jgi:polysaccharide deacetylase 2 family uncharacterized protein YibQ
MAKRRSSGRAKWILLLLLVAGLAYYFHLPDKTVKETGVANQLYTLEKTGAGVIIDYTATSRRIHAAVDSGLAGAKLTVQSSQETRRDVPRQKVEGAIRWNARQLLITVPVDTKIETVQQAIAGQLKTSGGEVLATQVDNYQGLPVVRLDVGVRDSLAGDPLTLITDRVYVAKKKPDALPVIAEKGKMALIIDDFGYSGDAIASFAALPKPITFSVIPYHAYSSESTSRALSSGHQVMLHLPMEPLSGTEQSEPTTITVSMTDQEIRQTITKALQAVPGAVGVNNHQGSKATADRRVMQTALSTIKANSLFFVDSRTNSQSVAFDLSRQMGLRTGENDIFIDNSSDIGAIKTQLRTAIHMATRYGSVTAIGHARPNTAIAIREMLPEIEAAGVKLVFISDLVK